MPSDAASLPHPAAAGTVASWWPRLKRWAFPVLGVVVLALLLSHAHDIDWSGAWSALRQYPAALLLAVLGLTTCSHVLYGCYDFIGKRHTGHAVSWRRTWAIAVTSYAFNLNLGSLVGGVALRARLYARAGLRDGTIAEVVSLSILTNWLGYGLLAGGLFAAGVITPPGQAHLGQGALRAMGFAMMALVLAYVAACALAHGKAWTVRGKALSLPSPGLALAQLAVSVANWALMGAAMYLLLGQHVGYGTVLGVLMAASIVGVITPIPAGLGVLEAVYLALLSATLPQAGIMGAVLAYRALYYLLPLGGGVLMYLALERHAHRHPAAAGVRAA